MLIQSIAATFKIVALGCGAFLLQSCAGSVGNDRPSGSLESCQFRGKSFGSQPQAGMRQIQIASLLFSPRLVAEYVDPAEVLAIGDRQLEHISYLYSEDRLFKIAVQFREDRACSNARGVVPALEAEYRLTMRQFTPATSVESFLAQGTSGDVRVTVHCWREGRSWWSSIALDSLSLLSKVNSLDAAIKREAESKLIQRERDNLR